ncbi:hypothetical protein C8Q74DRAFT_1265458, partial [Fomes fomentarius]
MAWVHTQALVSMPWHTVNARTTRPSQPHGGAMGIKGRFREVESLYLIDYTPSEPSHVYQDVRQLGHLVFRLHVLLLVPV